MEIRLATLDDTKAISRLSRHHIERWQRMTSDGRAEDLPYSDLTIYERWLHGGAWMSVETGAIWLTHLLSGAGLPFVMVTDDDIIAYAETYLSYEQAPLDSHLHIGKLIVDDAVFQSEFVDYLQTATETNRLTVASTAYDHASLNQYRGLGFTDLTQSHRVNLSPQNAAIGYYKVSDHPNSDPEQIREWQMPIGRTECARQHWEQLWSDLWHAVPSIQQRQRHRLHFNASGQEALVLVEQGLYNPRSAEIFCWTPKPVTTHLLASIRDWSYKAGYRALTMTVNDRIANLIGADSEATAHQYVILGKED